jgi:hypothetical protein
MGCARRAAWWSRAASESSVVALSRRVTSRDSHATVTRRHSAARGAPGDECAARAGVTRPPGRVQFGIPQHHGGNSEHTLRAPERVIPAFYRAGRSAHSGRWYAPSTAFHICSVRVCLSRLTSQSARSVRRASRIGDFLRNREHLVLLCRDPDMELLRALPGRCLLDRETPARNRVRTPGSEDRRQAFDPRLSQSAAFVVVAIALLGARAPDVIRV